MKGEAATEAAAAAEESSKAQRESVREGGAESLAVRKAVQVFTERLKRRAYRGTFSE